MGRKTDIEETLKLGQHKPAIPVWLKWGVIAALAAAALWFAIGAGGSDGKVDYLAEASKTGDLTVQVSATGTIEPTNLVEISSELSGTVATVEVDYNDTVEVGQVLARLDVTKLQATRDVQEAALIAAEARLEQAQVTLHETADNYTSAEELESRGVTSHLSFIAVRAAYERAAANVQIADADRALAQANLDLIEADLAKAVITSPIRGIILEREVDAGQIVASALSAPTLFTIAEDLASMELRVDIDEADIGLVATGNVATFTVDAYDDDVFPATISQIRFAPEETSGVVTYKAILTIDNTDLRLRPGMTASADITVRELSDVLLVPNAALRYAPPLTPEDDGESGSGLLGLIMPGPPSGAVPDSGAGASVWVLHDDAPVEVPVEVGLSDGSWTQLTGGELSAGDAVITEQTEGK